MSKRGKGTVVVEVPGRRPVEVEADPAAVVATINATDDVVTFRAAPPPVVTGVQEIAGPGMTSEGAEHIRALESKVKELEEKARDLEGLGLALGAKPGESPMLAWLRVKAEVQKEIAGMESKLRLAGEKNPPAPAPSEHVVRAFERGARAERARALEQARVSGLQWGSNAEKKRGLEEFVRELRDERLQLPKFTSGGA